MSHPYSYASYHGVCRHGQSLEYLLKVYLALLIHALFEEIMKNTLNEIQYSARLNAIIIITINFGIGI